VPAGERVDILAEAQVIECPNSQCRPVDHEVVAFGKTRPGCWNVKKWLSSHRGFTKRGRMNREYPQYRGNGKPLWLREIRGLRGKVLL
jgi:hypothetical protein